MPKQIREAAQRAAQSSRLCVASCTSEPVELRHAFEQRILLCYWQLFILA